VPYELTLITRLRKAGWKVKIRDAERLEDPHVTILWKYKTWRLSLRTNQFLEKGQSWRQIDTGVQGAIEEAWETIKKTWDELYPENPITSKNDDEDD